MITPEQLSQAGILQDATAQQSIQSLSQLAVVPVHQFQQHCRRSAGRR